VGATRSPAPVERVELDVLQGKVSAEAAREEYGRRRRLRGGDRAVEPRGDAGGPAASPPFFDRGPGYERLSAAPGVRRIATGRLALERKRRQPPPASATAAASSIVPAGERAEQRGAEASAPAPGRATHDSPSVAM